MKKKLENKSSEPSKKRKSVPHNEEDKREDALLQPSRKIPKTAASAKNNDKVSIGNLPKMNRSRRQSPGTRKVSDKSLTRGSKTNTKSSSSKGRSTTPKKASKVNNEDPPAVKKKIIIPKRKSSKSPVNSSIAAEKRRKPLEPREPRSRSKGSRSVKKSSLSRVKNINNSPKRTSNNRAKSVVQNKSVPLSKTAHKLGAKKERKNDDIQISTDEDDDEFDEDMDIFDFPEAHGTHKSAKKPAKRQRFFRNILQLKITLVGIEPPIWRRMEIPENFNFAELHRAIRDAMGWIGMHLHAFMLPDENGKHTIRVSRPTGFGIPDPEHFKDDKDFKVKKYLKKEGDYCLYEYDMGDSWMHVVEFEDYKVKEKGEKYPRCVDGKRACPPEDCGGTDGYETLLEALRDENHSEHEDMKAWMEENTVGDFAPEKFNPNRIIFEDAPQRRMWVFVGDMNNR
jgi:hypothetical protein